MIVLLILLGFALGSVANAPLVGGLVGAVLGLFIDQKRLEREQEDLRKQLDSLKDLVAHQVAPPADAARPRALPTPVKAPQPASIASREPIVSREPVAAVMTAPVEPAAEVSVFAALMAARVEPASPATSTLAAPHAEVVAPAIEPASAIVVAAGEPVPFAAPQAVAGTDAARSAVAAMMAVTPVEPVLPPPTAPGPEAAVRAGDTVKSPIEAWDRAKPDAAPPGPEAPPLPPMDPLGDAFAAVRGWVLGGNPVLRIGVVLLFLGFAFLLRYASERGLVPIELRYAGVAAAGMALLGLGWWLRRRNAAYALILQGTGVAVLYLTVFAAIRLHPLLPPKLGLALLVAVTVGLAVLAVAQNARGLAAVAAIGGFAAPILASTGGGSHVALFTYLAVLNAGILAIAQFKAWRLLNTIGFVGTFGIGLAWGLRSYTPALYASTQPFLALFFLMYVAIGLLFARRKLVAAAEAPGERGELLRWSRRQADYVDGLVVFGPPTVGFGLQYAITAHFEFGAAFSAAALGLFHMALAWVLAVRGGARVLLLVEAYLALGVVFGTLAIPLGLDARWTSAAWAVEGAGLYWLALRQRRPVARGFALAVQAGAAIAYLDEVTLRGGATLLGGAPLGALMVGGSLLFAHDRLRRTDAAELSAWEPGWCTPLLAWFGLGFVYLIAPLCLRAEGTAIAWATAGLVTLFVGLKIRSRSYLGAALTIQLGGGAMFWQDIDRAVGGASGVLGSGWRGLMMASWIGLALIASMVLAARHPLVREDKRLLLALSGALLIGLGVVNVAVLFVLPFATAAAVWGGSGLVIVWLSVVLQQRSSFMFGMLLQLVAGAVFLGLGPDLLGDVAGLRPLGHIGFWTPAVLAVAAMIGAWRLRRASEDTDPEALDTEAMGGLSHLLLLWGAGWWGMTGFCEVARFVPGHLQAAALLLVAAGSAGLWAAVAGRTRWPALALLSAALTPVAAVVLALVIDRADHPLADLGWLAWPAVVAVHLVSVWRLAPLLPAQVVSAAHVLGCWLVLGVLALEVRFGLDSLAARDNAWGWLGWALVPSGFLLAMAAPGRLIWPVAAYEREYRALAAAPVAALLLGWLWLANSLGDGDAAPLPYLPVLNPLTIGMLIALFAATRWSFAWVPRLGVDADQLRRPLIAAAGVSLFAMLTGEVMRAVHHWAGVPFAIEALLASMLVQMGLSIVWTLVALGLMISGHLRGRRVRWTVGAALIGVVVIKLFFVELGNSGGLSRIISFIAVGVLLLIVGYFAPWPPARTDHDKDKAA
jgi:uncharacterized membrane protein